MVSHLLRCVVTLVTKTPYQHIPTPPSGIFVRSIDRSFVAVRLMVHLTLVSPAVWLCFVGLLVPTISHLLSRILPSPASTDHKSLPSPTATPVTTTTSLSSSTASALVDTGSALATRNAVFACLAAAFDTATPIQEISDFLIRMCISICRRLGRKL